MKQYEYLAEQFEKHRSHLRGVAYRMLGSTSEADDAVQESWLHLTRSNPDGVENMGGWLTTVVARVCLDMLRSRNSRREEPLEMEESEAALALEGAVDPEHEALLVDSVGLALLVVLDTLGPSERLAFVLHDIFGMPFDEIAGIVGRTPTAARQLASRARRRVRGANTTAEPDYSRQREVVAAFLAASRSGEFEKLVALLDPGVTFRADQFGISAGSESEAIGPEAVAGIFSGRAKFAQPALIDGVPGLAWAPGGKPRVLFEFVVKDGKITEVRLTADPARLREVDLTLFKG